MKENNVQGYPEVQAGPGPSADEEKDDEDNKGQIFAAFSLLGRNLEFR